MSGEMPLFFYAKRSLMSKNIPSDRIEKEGGSEWMKDKVVLKYNINGELLLFLGPFCFLFVDSVIFEILAVASFIYAVFCLLKVLIFRQVLTITFDSISYKGKGIRRTIAKEQIKEIKILKGTLEVRTEDPDIENLTVSLFKIAETPELRKILKNYKYKKYLM
ncbi:hypothetical protein LCM20_16985 [Halobacillus litoralis]|uniref:hypothetical protein n=1 Tax=Halobacillus litoralis TaxID=45668 RepID=UPI001CD6EFE7|nr:hypothetical protein [Halobacillus litoralis]MCA0972305.1 hypothetical protein [Halobacillus litoralis]